MSDKKILVVSKLHGSPVAYYLDQGLDYLIGINGNEIEAFDKRYFTIKEEK